MIGEKMAAALNKQMDIEFYNSRLYLSMATAMYEINLEGAAKWLEMQAREEEGHALKIYGHLKERGARILLGALEAPPTDFDCPLKAFKAAYAHECKVSKMIDDLVDLADAEGDKPAAIMLQWFVTEQVEEEGSTDRAVQMLTMAGENLGAVMMVDRALAARGAGG